MTLIEWMQLSSYSALHLYIDMQCHVCSSFIHRMNYAFRIIHNSWTSSMNTRISNHTHTSSHTHYSSLVHASSHDNTVSHIISHHLISSPLTLSHLISLHVLSLSLFFYRIGILAKSWVERKGVSAVVVVSVCCLPDLISVVSTCQYVSLSFHPMLFVVVATCLLLVCYTRLLEVAHGTYMRINTSTIYMHDTVYNMIRYTHL